jgi:hypothetical protein
MPTSYTAVDAAANGNMSLVMLLLGLFLLVAAVVAVFSVIGAVELPDPGAPAAPGPRPAVPVQVVFANPSPHDVLLDCIACDPGTPFTVRARRLSSAAWADALIDNVLNRWADTGAPVEMVMLDGPTGPEVRLFDDTTRVQLPIAA